MLLLAAKMSTSSPDWVDVTSGDEWQGTFPMGAQSPGPLTNLTPGQRVDLDHGTTAPDVPVSEDTGGAEPRMIRPNLVPIDHRPDSRPVSVIVDREMIDRINDLDDGGERRDRPRQRTESGIRPQPAKIHGITQSDVKAAIGEDILLPAFERASSPFPVPGLRVVARNDAPSASETADRPAPSLCLVETYGDVSVDAGRGDLIDRLATRWEDDFVTADEPPRPAWLPATDAVVDLTARLQAPQGAAAPLPTVTHRDDRIALIGSDTAHSTEPTESRDAQTVIQAEWPAVCELAPFDADADPTLPQGGSASGHCDATADTPPVETVRASLGELAPGSKASIVPLFGDLLTQENVARESVARAPLFAVRQAAAEIAQEIERLSQTGGSELSFSLRLHPESLGSVEVEISRSVERWSARIVTVCEEARAIMSSEIHRLKHRLLELGFSVAWIDVVVSSANIVRPVSTDRDTNDRPSIPAPVPWFNMPHGAHLDMKPVGLSIQHAPPSS